MGAWLTPRPRMKRPRQRPAHVVRELEDDLVDLLGGQLAAVESGAELRLQDLRLAEDPEHPDHDQAAVPDVEPGPAPDLSEDVVDGDRLVRRQRGIDVDAALVDLLDHLQATAAGRFTHVCAPRSRELGARLERSL